MRHRPLFRFLFVHLPIPLKVTLVSYNDDLDVLAHDGVEFLEPYFDFVERVFVSDVVREDGALGVAIVNGTQGVETFLTGRVPDRDVDGGIADFHFDVREHGRFRGAGALFVEGVPEEALKERRFADTAFSEHDDFQLPFCHLFFVF